MKCLVTIGRVRSVLDDVKTESDAALVLRRHRIRYSYSTEGGIFHIRIPASSGIITVTRTASRSAPLAIAAAPAVSAPFPFPLR